MPLDGADQHFHVSIGLCQGLRLALRFQKPSEAEQIDEDSCNATVFAGEAREAAFQEWRGKG
jgi:hypothetical protein